MVAGLDAPRRRGEDGERRDTSRQRDREDGRRERDDRRADRDRDDRDKDDRRRVSGRDRDSERDRDEDRHWRDDGRRDERLSTRRERERDDKGDRDDQRDRESVISRERRGDREEPSRRGAREDRDEEYESKSTRRGNRGGEGRRSGAADDEKGDKDRKDRERQKEQPAWMETYVPDSTTNAATKEGAKDLQAWKKEMKEKVEKDKAAADSPANVASLPAGSSTRGSGGGANTEDDGLDEIAKFKLMMKRAQETPAPEPAAVDPAIAEAISAPAPKRDPPENGISGLRRIMGKDMKSDDTVLRSAGFAVPRKQSTARLNDGADGSDFESGLVNANASTSTPVIAHQASMDPTISNVASDRAPSASRLDALFRDSAISNTTSSTPPVSAKIHNDPAVASTSFNSVPQPRLFSFAPHAQAAMQNQLASQPSISARTIGGPPAQIPTNNVNVQPELTSRLNIDATPSEQGRGFSPFERPGPGAISPPLTSSLAPSIDTRARASPGHNDRASLGSVDSLSTYPDRINTASAAISSNQSDQPLSPQSAAGYGSGQPKGSRFAKFFHDRPTAAAGAAQAPSVPGLGSLHPQQQQSLLPQSVQSLPQHSAGMQRPLESLSPGGLGGAGNNNIQDLLSMLHNSSMQTQQLPQAVGRQHVPPTAPNGSLSYQPLHLLNRNGGDAGFNDHYAQEQLVQQLRASRSRDRPPHVMNTPGMFGEPDDVGMFATAAQRLPPSQQAIFEQLQAAGPGRQQQQMYGQAPQQRAMGMPPMGPPGAGFRPVPSPSQHLLQQQQQQQQQRGVPAALASLGQRPPLDPNQFIGSGAGLGMGGMLPSAGNPGVMPSRGMLSPQQQAPPQFGGGFGGPTGFVQQQQQQQRNLLGGDFTVQPRGPLPPPGHVLSSGLRNVQYGNPGQQQFGQQQQPQPPMGMRGAGAGGPMAGHLGPMGPPPPHMQLPMSGGHQAMGSTGQADLMALLMGGRLE